MSEREARELDAAYWGLPRERRKAVDRAIARGRAVEDPALAPIAARRAAFEREFRSGRGALLADVLVRALVALNLVWAIAAKLPAWALALIALAAGAAAADLARVVLRTPLARRAEQVNTAREHASDERP